MVTHTFSLGVQLNAISKVGCMNLVWASKSASDITGFPNKKCRPLQIVSDAFGTCSSSLILCLRTFAVWGHDRRVGASLLLIFLGQIVLWTQSTFHIGAIALSQP
jgi:hypothetical protein